MSTLNLNKSFYIKKQISYGPGCILMSNFCQVIGGEI